MASSSEQPECSEQPEWSFNRWKLSAVIILFTISKSRSTSLKLSFFSICFSLILLCNYFLAIFHIFLSNTLSFTFHFMLLRLFVCSCKTIQDFHLYYYDINAISSVLSIDFRSCNEILCREKQFQSITLVKNLMEKAKKRGERGRDKKRQKNKFVLDL